MKKLLKAVTVSLVGMMMIPSLVFADGKIRTFEKTYEVKEAGNTYTFYLENSVGDFHTTVTMPNGFVTKADAAKITDGDKIIYRAKFQMNDAPEGKYVFEINTEHATYFNLIVKTNLFSDLNNHWAEEAINKFYDKGIINGFNDNTFKPDITVTGEQFIKMMVLSLTEDNPSGKRQYIDSLRFNATEGKDRESIMNAEYDLSEVNVNNWFESYYKVIKDTSLLDNFNNNVKDGLTRKDASLLMANVLKITEDKDVSDRKTTFTDIGSLDTKYLEAIKLLNSYSLITGYEDNTFRPDKVVTRAEAVTLLSRFLLYYQ